VDIILEKEKEASIFIEGGTNTLFKEILFSTESIRDIIEHRRPDSVVASQACSSLLLYRLVDAIVFSNGHQWTGSIVPRLKFPKLNIPVRSFFVRSLSILKLHLSRAGSHSIMTGAVL
jgi:hypothetical protein